jgi:hypothetical protein
VRRPAVVFDVVRSLRRELGNETGFRFAAVFARITARTANIRQQGRDVFTMQNAAMRRQKRQNRFAEWHIFHDARDTGLSRLTKLCNGLISRMSPYQFEVYALMSQGASQKAAAGQLGKFTQPVSDAVRRAGIDLIINAERQILSPAEHT